MVKQDIIILGLQTQPRPLIFGNASVIVINYLNRIAMRDTKTIIDQTRACTECEACMEVCPNKFEAVSKIDGETVPDSIPEDKRTIVRQKAGKGTE